METVLQEQPSWGQGQEQPGLGMQLSWEREAELPSSIPERSAPASSKQLTSSAVTQAPRPAWVASRFNAILENERLEHV